MMETELIRLYEATVGTLPEEVIPINGSGSSRSYFRMEGTRTIIGTIGTDKAENEAFIYLSGFFKKAGVNVPAVLAVSADRMAYLQTDCGAEALFDCLDRGDLLNSAMCELVKMQFAGAEGLDYSKCFPVAAFDARSIMWDLNYFKYCFLKPSATEFDEALLEDDFRRMAKDLAVRDDEQTFMMRDFQSRNVMVSDDGRVTLIDFQGGRRGPVFYDLASFLWQARAGFTPEQRERLIDAYLDAAGNRITLSRAEFVARLKKYVFLRQLQTLGAYGFRGLVEQKAHFIKSIPAAIANISDSVADGFKDYPYLTEIVRRMTADYPTSADEKGCLTLKIGSFSFMKGIPVDQTGNGGGFVFDCRGLPNPGRYERYKKSTGRDTDVIEFLEKEATVEHFISSAIEMVRISVETYVSRGFSSLMVNFGCTGGQHRSVYCAERLARIFRNAPGVRVVLTHREQNIREVCE